LIKFYYLLLFFYVGFLVFFLRSGRGDQDILIVQ